MFNTILAIITKAFGCVVLLLALVQPVPCLAQEAQAEAPEVVRKIAPERLLVRPKSARHAPKFLNDPSGWIRSQQRYFYGKMAMLLHKIRSGDRLTATWSLILISFVYGVLHAAGPGHGKAVVSAWLLANEQQLKRGVIIAAMAAIIQAATAIVVVTGVLFVAKTAGTQARFFTTSLEAISFGLIALTGVYLIWRTLKGASGVFGANAHTHTHHHHTKALAHKHDHHVHDETCSSQNSELNCDCGHAHMPAPNELNEDWSWLKAISIAFVVGIRPCSGAILVLLLSSSVGLYWAGVASTFAMAIGTGITVSLVAVLTVTSKNLALKLTSGNSLVLARVMFAVKLSAGVFIVLTGSFLFWATWPRVLT